MDKKKVKIKRLKIPLLADGQYTEWIFKMAGSLHENAGSPDMSREWYTLRVLDSLVGAELEYTKVYEVFLNENYLTDDNREKMEEGLKAFETKISRFVLYLVSLLLDLGFTSAVILEYYKNVIEDNQLSILQGAKEPLNLSLQVGHWENYIVSEVGWSLRGAFSIVPPAESLQNPMRAYIANRLSNDSVYVMRIKQYEITVKLIELLSIGSEAKRNIKAMELWMAVFNFFNYIDAKPLRLWGIVLEEYSNTINLMENHANNK